MTEMNKAFVYGNFARRTIMMTVKKMLHIMETPLNSSNKATVTTLTFDHLMIIIMVLN